MTKHFAMICWLLWGALLVAGASAAMPRALALAMGAAVYALWRLYRRAATSN